MAGKGGGAWKVAYADFVTAMMAFFLVMWLVSQKEGVKEAVAGYFRDPFATYKSHEKGAAGTAKPVKDPMYGHTAQPQKRRIAISGDRTDYQFTVLFQPGLAELDDEQLEAIREFAPMMVGKLNRIEVRGHCVRQPLPPHSPYKSHWELCFARSQAVMDELIRNGIEAQRIRLSQAEGNEPLSLNLSSDELKLNSRVDVILLPDLADIPWERQKRSASDAASDAHGAGEQPSAAGASHATSNHAAEHAIDASGGPAANDAGPSGAHEGDSAAAQDHAAQPPRGEPAHADHESDAPSAH